MEPERADIRAAIIDALRGEGPRGKPPNQYQGLLKGVAYILDERGFREGVSSGPMGGTLKGRVEQRFREEVWDLIGAGVLVPGLDANNTDWPFLSLTEPGRQLVEGSEPTPADPDGYVGRVNEIIPGERQRVLIYLREAVGAFNRNLYIAATVMLGVAAEGLLFRLAEAIAAAYPDREEGQEWYNEEFSEIRSALRQFRAVREKVEAVADELPHELREGFEAHWHSIHALLRMERNEGGHPTGTERSRSEVHSSLVLFPTLAKLVRDFEEWVGRGG